MPLQALTFLLDFLGRTRCTRRFCGFTFLREASVRRSTCVDETLTKLDAQPMTCAGIRYDVSAQPVPQQISCVVARQNFTPGFEPVRP